jgi:Methyltransferase FkbM domain
MNDFSFEESVLEKTRCRVFTLDCTVENPTPPANDRLKFLKICLGSKPGYQNVSDVANNEDVDRIDVLKMDIEGNELDVLTSFVTSAREDPAGTSIFLPDQISLEVHEVAASTPNAGIKGYGVIMGLLAQLGYSLMSRDDNTRCPGCSEFTYLRTAC